MWPRGLSGAAFVALGAFDLGHKRPQSRSPPVSAGGSAGPGRGGLGLGAAGREASGGSEGEGLGRG